MAYVLFLHEVKFIKNDRYTKNALDSAFQQVGNS